MERNNRSMLSSSAIIALVLTILKSTIDQSPFQENNRFFITIRKVEALSQAEYREISSNTRALPME